MSEAKKKKGGRKKRVVKVDQEEEMLNEVIRQEKESDEEDYKSEEGDQMPNEFEKLVDQVAPTSKKNFMDRIKVPEKVLAPKTFIISQNAELKIIDHVKEQREKEKIEKLRKKEDSRFRYHAVGFSGGLDDQAGDFDFEEEEIKARNRHFRNELEQKPFMKEFKPSKKDMTQMEVENNRHHNQKLAIRKEILLQDNNTLEDLVKIDFEKIHKKEIFAQEKKAGDRRNEANK